MKPRRIAFRRGKLYIRPALPLEDWNVLVLRAKLYVLFVAVSMTVYYWLY